REDGPGAGEVVGQPPPGALGMRARLCGRAVEAASRMETDDAALGRLDPELADQLLEADALGPKGPQHSRRERARRLGGEELLEHPVDSIHLYSSSAFFKIALPRAS